MNPSYRGQLGRIEPSHKSPLGKFGLRFEGSTRKFLGPKFLKPAWQIRLNLPSPLGKAELKKPDQLGEAGLSLARPTR